MANIRAFRSTPGCPHAFFVAALANIKEDNTKYLLRNLRTSVVSWPHSRAYTVVCAPATIFETNSFLNHSRLIHLNSHSCFLTTAEKKMWHMWIRYAMPMPKAPKATKPQSSALCTMWSTYFIVLLDVAALAHAISFGEKHRLLFSTPKLNWHVKGNTGQKISKVFTLPNASLLLHTFAYMTATKSSGGMRNACEDRNRNHMFF